MAVVQPHGPGYCYFKFAGVVPVRTDYPVEGWSVARVQESSPFSSSPSSDPHLTQTIKGVMLRLYNGSFGAIARAGSSRLGNMRVDISDPHENRHIRPSIAIVSTREICKL